MTDKGMPDRVWIRSIGNGNGGLYSTVDRSDSGPCTIFIRADIVEELVGALRMFMASAHDYQSGLQEGEDALDRYNAATEGK